MKDETAGRGFWGLQFHPEVSHTENGTELLKKFLFDACGAKVNWDGSRLVNHLVDDIRNQVGPKKKFCVLLSGGVDSTVTMVLS